MHRLGSVLIVVGGGLLVFAVLWQLGVAPGSRVTLPAPVALSRPTVAPVPTALLATPEPAPTSAPAPMLLPLALAPRVSAPLPSAPDAADRAADANLPPPGYAVRLAIPSIKLDTEVRQGGIVEDENGNPTYQTLPFVAVHYGDLTALVGAHGNAVIAGHVVTLREGNVFRFLYQLDIDDEIEVWDQSQREHDFTVTDVKLVPPDDLSPMAQTFDPTLTLITCGGTFDPVKREFSDRLIVTARLKPV